MDHVLVEIVAANAESRGGLFDSRVSRILCPESSWGRPIVSRCGRASWSASSRCIASARRAMARAGSSGRVSPGSRCSVGFEGEHEVAGLAACAACRGVCPFGGVVVGRGDDQRGFRGGALGEVGCLRVGVLDVACVEVVGWDRQGAFVVRAKRDRASLLVDFGDGPAGAVVESERRVVAARDDAVADGVLAPGGGDRVARRVVQRPVGPCGCAG